MLNTFLICIRFIVSVTFSFIKTVFLRSTINMLFRYKAHGSSRHAEKDMKFYSHYGFIIAFELIFCYDADSFISSHIY